MKILYIDLTFNSETCSTTGEHCPDASPKQTTQLSETHTQILRLDGDRTLSTPEDQNDVDDYFIGKDVTVTSDEQDLSYSTSFQTSECIGLVGTDNENSCRHYHYPTSQDSWNSADSGDETSPADASVSTTTSSFFDCIVFEGTDDEISLMIAEQQQHGVKSA